MHWIKTFLFILSYLLPKNGILTGFVFSFSFHTDNLHTCSSWRSGNLHLFNLNVIFTTNQIGTEMYLLSCTRV